MARSGIRICLLLGAALCLVAAAMVLGGPATTLADDAKLRRAPAARAKPRAVRPRFAPVRPRPSPVAKGDLPAELRLAPARRRAVLRNAGVPKGGGGSDPTMRLTPRVPHLDATTYMSFFQANVNPAFDPPRADFAASTVQAQTSMAEVSFRALPGKAYLVSCAVSGGRTYFISIWNGSASQAQTQQVPGGGSLAVAVPSASSPRQVSVYLAANKYWALTACEVTPVG